MSINRTGFPSIVNLQMPPAVAGEFASMNPRASVLAGSGALKAALAVAVICGNFAWAASDGVAYGSNANGGVVGFVANDNQTVITDFLGQSRLSVQAGFPVTLFSRGDFWALVNGAGNLGAVALGDAIYADRDTGAPTTYAAAFQGTGTIDNGAGASGTVLTITAVRNGVLRIGDVLTGTGVTPATTVTVQVSGTPGGIGVYTVDTAQDDNPAGGAISSVAQNATTGFTAASASAVDPTAVTCSLAAGTGVLTVGAVTGPPIQVGANVSGTGVPANLFITAQLTGTAGQTGTYKVNTIGPAVASFTGTFSVGRLVQITNQG